MSANQIHDDAGRWSRAMRGLSRIAVVFCAMSVVLVAMPLTRGAPPPAQAPSDLDDALLKDLDNELLDGAGDLKQKPAKNPPETAPAGEADGPMIDGEDVGMPSAEQDPLGYISQEMRSVERLIPQGKRGPAQQMQQRILEDLTKLIEQAQKQADSQQQLQNQQQNQRQSSQRQKVQQPSSGSPDKESNKPAKDSTERLGQSKETRPDPAAMKSLMKNSWGHLPARAREQMLQTSPERFVPQYELMIERYYQRLAEEPTGK